MPNTTSRLTLQEPLTTDAPSELRLAITNNAGTLDGSVIVTEGTLASRPAGSYYGQTYYATDTGLWYFYTGSAWETVLLAGAWQNLTLGTSISAAAGEYTPSARIEGDTVRLKGALSTTGSIAGGATVATIPSGLRPTAQQARWVIAYYSSGPTFNQQWFWINTNGTMQGTVGYSSGGVIYLDDIAFTLS